MVQLNNQMIFAEKYVFFLSLSSQLYVSALFVAPVLVCTKLVQENKPVDNRLLLADEK